MTIWNWFIPGVIAAVVGAGTWLGINVLQQNPHNPGRKGVLAGIVTFVALMLVSWAFFSPHQPAAPKPQLTRDQAISATVQAMQKVEPTLTIEQAVKATVAAMAVAPTDASVVAPTSMPVVQNTPMPSSGGGGSLTCRDYEIPDPQGGKNTAAITRAWSNASYLWFAAKTSFKTTEPRWVKDAQGSGWHIAYNVSIDIPWANYTRRVDLQQSKTHGADFYNDLIKHFNLCDDPQSIIAVLFGSDGAGLANDWAVEVHPDGTMTFVAVAGNQYDQLINAATEYVLP